MKICVILLILSLSLISLANCPDLTRKETLKDCPWAEITRKIVDENKACTEVLSKSAPQILKNLKRDRKINDYLNYWGEAKNFDDNAKAVIVNPKIINCLADYAHLKSPYRSLTDYDVVHAGLQHTYAYLFSNLDTPYGYKRARWTSGDLQQGLNLKFLIPRKSGSFLANVTYLFAKFAFTEQSPEVKTLLKIGKKHNLLSQEIINLQTDNFEIQNLIEEVPNKFLELHTTFIKFKSAVPDSKNSYLLIYWYSDLKANKRFFITGFPVEESFVTKALDSKNLGENKPITTRYNAWISGISDSTDSVTGSRKLSH